MVFAAATRAMSRRRSSAISIHPADAPSEVGEIPIILGFDIDPFSVGGRRESFFLTPSPNDGGTWAKVDIDIGDYPMAILTRGATSSDPIIQVAPHVHIIHAAKRAKERIATSFLKSKLGHHNSLRLSVPSEAYPSPIDGETTPTPTSYSNNPERHLPLKRSASFSKLDPSPSASANMALSRRAHVRLPSGPKTGPRPKLTKRPNTASGPARATTLAVVKDVVESPDENLGSSSFLPLRSTRPLKVRPKKSTPDPSPSFDTDSIIIPFQSTNTPVPVSPPTPTPVASCSYVSHESLIFPFTTPDFTSFTHPYAYSDAPAPITPTTPTPASCQSQAQFRRKSSVVSATIDWSLIETTLGCASVSLPPMDEDARSDGRSSGSRTPTQGQPSPSPSSKNPKPFTDRPLPPVPVPKIVVHQVKEKTKRRGGVVIPAVGVTVGARKSEELLPGCSGIEFD